MPHDKPHSTLPAFTPVPRERDRANGWNPQVQIAFIEALAETGSVRAACRLVGRSEHGAYDLRRHPAGEGFRTAWQAALDLGIRRIEDIAMDRAINGVEEPVYSYGKLVGTRIRYNDRLLMFMLRNRAGDRFADGRARALSALDQATLKKLKQQWRQEYDRERAIADAAREDREGDEVLARIELMHRRWYCMLSPETRAVYREFRRLEDLDQAGGFGWMDRADARQNLAAAEAEYEEYFNRTRDKRPHVMKLADMREWDKPEPEEGAEDEDDLDFGHFDPEADDHDPDE